MPCLKIVMIGDVMGESGLKVLEEKLPRFFDEQKPDFIIVNGENTDNGFGLSESALNRILALGVDIVSSGNHVWEKRDFWPVLDSEKRIIRPANYPDGPGRGFANVVKEINGKNITFLAINLQGREFLSPIDCPFRCFDSILDEAVASEVAVSEAQTPETLVVLVDFHAESTREKEAFAFHVDGRASVVAGTHTHVQTADEKILPKGTAYISDLGMTGVTDAVIGIDPKICIDRVKSHVLYRMEAATGGSQTRIQGIIALIDDESRNAISIERLNL